MAVQGEATTASGVFETLLVTDGRPVRLDRHLARLGTSLQRVFKVALPTGCETQARRFAATLSGRSRMRLTVTVPHVGPVLTTFESSSAPAVPTSVALRSSTQPPGSWRHKWTDRSILEAAEALAGPPRLPLFLNRDGNVLETTRGNIFIVDESAGLITPPLSSNILPGVTRDATLRAASAVGTRVREASVPLAKAREMTMFMVNSLVGLVPVAELDSHPMRWSDDARSLTAELAREMAAQMSREEHR